MRYSLRREPWWNAVKRARSKRARAASQDAAVGNPAFAGVPLPSFFFFFFVARMERSVIRGGGASGDIVPGFRCAPSGLRNQERKTERQAPPLPFPWTGPVSR